MASGGLSAVRVFVSHTSDMAAYPADRSFVRAALDAVNRAGMVPVDMRYFPARPGHPAGYCRDRVRDCDVYVAVVGFRYGSVVPGEPVSYTEVEFAEATAAGMPRLVFLLDEPDLVPAGLVDDDRAPVDGFRQRLRDAGLVVRGFATADKVELEVYHGLTELTAGGPGRSRSTLPADLPVFVGRDTELDRIVADAAPAGGVIAIHAIDGMPGIGKTALAVHVAHRLAAQFPDGQLFVDLHAHTPGQAQVHPGDALADLLAADGVDPRSLPATVDARAGMWRDRTAGRRLLLVLDNVASTEQVRSLLPGSPGCLVLVTSRRGLGDLPSAVPMALDVLAPAEAVAMFLRLEPRAAADAEAVAELVRACGHLPLAVSIMASLYSRHQAWTIVDLRREVQRLSGGLITARAENRTVAAVFDLSYQHLPPDRQVFFRRLGLHPGVGIDAYAAAALTDTGLDEATGHLDELHNDHLLEEPAYHRYRMHDLTREYARNLATMTDPADVRNRAVERLLDYYQHTATRADTRLSRHTRPATTVDPPAPTPPITGWDQAAAWLRAERPNLLACIRHTTAGGPRARTVALTAGVAALLRTDGPWTQAADLHAAAATVAHQLGDQLGQATALHELGHVRRLTGDYPGAADPLERSLDLHRALGDQCGEANVLYGLGVVRWLTGDYPDAADLLGRSLDLYRALGDRRGEATVLRYLGDVRWRIGDYPDAAGLLGQSLKLHRELGDRHGEAIARTHLGVVRYLTRDYASAADLLQHALAALREVGAPDDGAEALNHLAIVHRLSGQPDQARALHHQALDIARSIHHRLEEAHALEGIGRAALDLGDTAAGTHLRQALDIYQRLGVPEAVQVAAALAALGRHRPPAPGDSPPTHDPT